MSEILTLIKCIPILLGLIRSIEAGIKQAETDETVADHLKKIQTAFATQDSSALDSIFNAASAAELPVGSPGTAN